VLWNIYPPIPDITDFPFYSAAFLTWGAMALGVIFWFVGTHRNIFLMLMPLWIFCLSLSGIYALKSASVFPLMPLLTIMIALTRRFLNHFHGLSKWSNAACYPLTILVAAVLLFHALAGYQLWFYENAFERPTPFKTAKLRGMSASPEVVAGVDAIVGFIDQLPPEDTIALIPTEDPVYFLTNRKSPIKILQRYYNSGGDPNTKYLPELQRVSPDWVIVKTTPQFRFYQPLTLLEVAWIKANYEEVYQLEQYLIWKRVEHGKS
jgi:hypothetical protein